MGFKVYFSKEARIVANKHGKIIMIAQRILDNCYEILLQVNGM